MDTIDRLKAANDLDLTFPNYPPQLRRHVEIDREFSPKVNDLDAGIDEFAVQDCRLCRSRL